MRGGSGCGRLGAHGVGEARGKVGQWIIPEGHDESPRPLPNQCRCEIIKNLKISIIIENNLKTWNSKKTS